MDTKNLNNLFNDDFVDLFNEANMEIDEIENSQDSTVTYLRMLEDDKSIQKRLEGFQTLATKFVPRMSITEVDKKILQYLMPATKDLLTDIFKEICQTLSSADTQQKTNNTLKFLQEYLQICIIIHEGIDCILEHIIRNEQINPCQIQSLPLNMVHILLTTLQHCKESENVYKNYFDDLKEILSLFKAAQDVHKKLLNLLDKHIDFNSLLEEQIMLFKNVLKVLGEIGEVLVDMNVKALADNWKGYMSLTQKLAYVLNRNCFDISRPLTFLSAEISKNLNVVLNMDAGDQKGVNQILKICNFFIRVTLKLCETFWPSLERICASVLDFLSTMHNFFPPFLQFKGYSESTISQINSLVFVYSEQLLDRLLCEPEFFKVAASITINEANLPGLLFLLITIFQKLPIVIKTNKTAEMCEVYGVVELFFEVVKESYSELFWKLKMPTTNGQRSLYDESVINITLTILSLNAKEYDQIQIIFFKNILQDRIWAVLLATDIWCLILRKRSPQLCCETLFQLIDKTKPLLSNNFTNRPEELFLENLLQRLYAILPEEYKISLVEKYPPSLNLHIWKVLGFRNYPKSQVFMIESLLINLMEKIEGFRGGKCSVNDFNCLCHGLDAISSLSDENGIQLKYLLLVMVKVWDFEPNSGLYESALFRLFMGKLCRATCNFVQMFNNEQLLMILTKLKQLLNSDFNIKIEAIQILQALSSKTLEQSPEQNQIMTTLSELFHTLLLDKNPLIKQAILEVFVDFLNTTPHEKIAQDAVRNEAELRKVISNFIQRHAEDKRTISVDDYFLNQKTYEFKHVCPKLPVVLNKIKSNNDFVMKSLNLPNKNKIDEGEVNVLVKRIKTDVKSLHKLFGKENMSEESITEIVNILSRHVDYRI